MRLLDLFCCAGGCSMGYHRAGFKEIVGVDNRPQPRYPFTFVQGDALEYVAEHGHKFDAIHASPPCQAYSMTNNIWKNDAHPDLVLPTRNALDATGKKYVIENVPGAPLINSETLCGHMFGLRVYRHRLFETNWFFHAPPHRRHRARASYGRTPKADEFYTISGHFGGFEGGKLAMGIDWMGRDELCQAIPPAYTKYIGKQLLDLLRSA